MTESGAPPRVFIVVAAVLATTFAVVVAVLGLTSSSAGEDSAAPAGPLPLVSIPAPEAETPQCAALLRAVPEELKSAGETVGRRELAQPAPPATAAWGERSPVVLRCGLDRPPELTRTAALRLINGVQWLEVPEQASATWYVVDRDVYLALTVPSDAGTGPLQDISGAVARTLPAVPLSFD